MDGGGGFLFDSGRSSQRVDRTEGTADHAGNRQDDTQDASTSAKHVRALTQKQEIRLMNYLDDAFLNLTRNYSKRYTAPESSSVSTLDVYVTEMERIVGIIASIPPVGSSAPLLVSYLLRATSEICDGILGYDLAATTERRGGDEADAELTMEKVQLYLQQAVQALDLYDRVWSAVLRGHSVDLEAVRKHVREASIDSQTHAHVLSNIASSSETTGRYNNDAQASKSAESHRVLGSKGSGTVGQTHRIRLRNVITLAKENLFTWMRTQLNAPLPPMIEGSDRDARQERKELVGVEGDVDQAEEMRLANERARQTEVVKDEEEEEDQSFALEAVDTGSTYPQQLDEAETVEQKHFTDLFSKSIDPDASEDENGTEDEDRSDRSKKRARHDPDVDDASELDTAIPPTEAESEATFGLTSGPIASAIMRWDVAFAHLFGRTLRCLSDLQEYSEQRTERQRTQANDDAAVLAS